MSKRDRPKHKRGPTPKRRAPRVVWRARCEGCGFLDVIHHDKVGGPNRYSPCPSCEGATAVYVAVTL